MKEKTVSIKDVAKKAGVSLSTVSRVLNNTCIVSDELRDKVMNAVNSMDYVPNQAARSLVSSRTNTIGVIVNNMHDQAVRELSGAKIHISNRAFRNWNSSIYKYNEGTKSYVLKKGITVGADVPKRIDWRGV